MSTPFYCVTDVIEILGVSRGYAYKIIKELNTELLEKGYRVVNGKIPKKYFQERFYAVDAKGGDE